MPDPSIAQSRLRAGLEILAVVALYPALAWLSVTTGLIIIGPLGTLLIVLLATALLKSRGLGWRDLGLRRPAHWGKTVLWVIAAYAAIALVVMGLLSPALEAAGLGQPDISYFRIIEGNLPLLMLWLVISWAVGAFAEELVARGFLLNRFADLFGGGGRRAFYLAAIAQGGLFGLAHAYQGVAGIIMTGSVGIMLGLLYVLARRSLWPGILTHGLVDSISFIGLYLGLGTSP